jgi:VCBS repeat-containing protein
VHRILRKYGVPLLIVPGLLLGVSLSAITLAPVTTAPSHSDSRFATLTDDDQLMAPQNAVNPVTVTASDASYVTAQDTELLLPEGTLQINDSDDNPDSGVSCCSATLTAAPSNGAVTVDANGSFTYTPASGFSGSDAFQYSLTDSDGNVSAPADVTITVGSGVQATNTAIVYAYPPAASASVPVTFTAQVTTEGRGPAPTGTITFTWYNSGNAGGGPVTGTIGTAPLSSGSATLTTQPGDLPAGVDASIRITAIYSGDSFNASSAGGIFYDLQRTCDEGQWPAISNGIPNVPSPAETEGYYIGQVNGWFSVSVSGTAKYTGYIETNGQFLYLTSTKSKSADHLSLRGKHGVTYSISDKGHLLGFEFYAACASKISFHLDINGAKAPTNLIFLGNPMTNATKNPVVLTRSS